jgi:hypothetical protein
MLPVNGWIFRNFPDVALPQRSLNIQLADEIERFVAGPGFGKWGCQGVE